MADVRSYHGASSCTFDGLLVLLRHLCGGRAVTVTFSASSPNHHARSLVLFARCERQHNGRFRVDVVLIDGSAGLIDVIFRKQFWLLSSRAKYAHILYVRVTRLHMGNASQIWEK